MHRFAKILSSADKDGEKYQDGGRVLAVQSIDQIIVEVIFEVAEVDGCLDYAVHPGSRDGGGQRLN